MAKKSVNVIVHYDLLLEAIENMMYEDGSLADNETILTIDPNSFEALDDDAVSFFVDIDQAEITADIVEFPNNAA